MKLLIDTNIFIPLEPTSAADISINTGLAADLSKLAAQTKCEIWLHPAQQIDIANDSDINRRQMREVLLKKYPLLAVTPAHPPEENTNDWVDDQLVEAVRIGAVSALITEDRKLFRKANRVLGSGKVYYLTESISYLQTLVGVPPQPLLDARPTKTFNLDSSDVFWDTFRNDYDGFNDWLEKIKLDHRDCWVIEGVNGLMVGVLIVKWEGSTEFGEKTLKICSFKVDISVGGRKYGELLLKTVFKYCQMNSCDSIYVTVFSHHAQLIQLLGDFGFRKIRDTNSGEELWAKLPRYDVSSTNSVTGILNQFIVHGPCCAVVSVNDIHVIPVIPSYHERLFPELSDQAALLAAPVTGNTLRKVYISRANRRNLAPGSILLFYRSRSTRDIVAWGVLEETLTSRSVDEICAFVMPRTVYSRRQIEEMCEEGAVLAMMFRQGLIEPKEPLKLAQLVESGALGAHPQSITRLKHPGADLVESWLS